MVAHKKIFFCIIFAAFQFVMARGNAEPSSGTEIRETASAPVAGPVELKKPYVICISDFTVAAGAAGKDGVVTISAKNPGADYLEAELGKHKKLFSCMDRALFDMAKKNMKMPPEGPQKYLQNLFCQTGAMFLIEAKIMPVRVRENKREVYGMIVGRTEYSFDVTLNVTDLVNGRSVYRQTYSTTHLDERPLTSNYFEKDVFYTMLKDVVAQIAEDLYSQYGEEADEEADE